MNDVRTTHVFSCVDKLIDLETDHSPSHDIEVYGTTSDNLTIVTKVIPFFENSRIATLKKWVHAERWGGGRAGLLAELLNISLSGDYLPIQYGECTVFVEVNIPI